MIPFSQETIKAALSALPPSQRKAFLAGVRVAADVLANAADFLEGQEAYEAAREFTWASAHDPDDSGSAWGSAHDPSAGEGVLVPGTE